MKVVSAYLNRFIKDGKGLKKKIMRYTKNKVTLGMFLGGAYFLFTIGYFVFFETTYYWVCKVFLQIVSRQVRDFSELLFHQP
jgi:hypothetical protein